MARRIPSRATVEALLSGLAVGEALALPYALAGEPPPAPSGMEPLLAAGRAAVGGVTESVLALAETLVVECGFNPGAFASRLAGVADLENPLRYYSPATVEVIARVKRGVPWTAAREAVSTPEPPADVVPRAAPIPLFYTKERLAGEMAAAQALTTTLDRDAVETARLHGLMLHYLLQGLPLVEAAEEAAAQTPRRHLADALKASLDLAAAAAPPPTAAAVLEVAAAPPARALAAAVYAALSGSHPRDRVWRAVLAAGQEAAAPAAAVLGALEAAAGRPLHVIEPSSLEAWEEIRRVSLLLHRGIRRCHAEGETLGEMEAW